MQIFASLDGGGEELRRERRRGLSGLRRGDEKKRLDERRLWQFGNVLSC